MNDKAIRKILISYLKATHSDIRIYQEKTIGKSVCDLMAVTDCLTGYEIKSDQDNYARLDSQIENYQDYFNKNYIVVGTSHVNSAEMKVPESWGIVVVSEDNIGVLRQAKPNKAMYIRSQLSVLWKLELENMLNHFRLPFFALKRKGFIMDKLIEAVPEEELSRQVAYELLHRDYSIFGATDYTESNDENGDENNCDDDDPFDNDDGDRD